MTFPGEMGQSIGNNEAIQSNPFETGASPVDFSSDTWERQERVLKLWERIVFGSPKGRIGAKREFDDLLAEQEALNAADLEMATSATVFSSPVKHTESVSARPARRPVLSPVYQFGLATMLAGTAMSAMIIPEANADEPSPPQPLSGRIGPDAKVDYTWNTAKGGYLGKLYRNRKSGPTTTAWFPSSGTAGDYGNGFWDGMKRIGQGIVGTVVKCKNTIIFLNQKTFRPSPLDSSLWKTDTEESSVMVSIAPTVTDGKRTEKNHCAPEHPDMLRLQPTRTPPAVVPPPAASENTDLDKKRKNTFFGGALATFILGLGGGAFWWIRRRNQMGVGLSSMVQGRPIEYTKDLKPSYSEPITDRLDTPLDALVGRAADLRLSRQISDLNGSGGDLTESAIEVHAAIRKQFKDNPQLVQQSPSATSQKR